MQDQGLDWEKCVWLCTDRAGAWLVVIWVQPQK